MPSSALKETRLLTQTKRRSPLFKKSSPPRPCFSQESANGAFSLGNGGGGGGGFIWLFLKSLSVSVIPGSGFLASGAAGKPFWAVVVLVSPFSDGLVPG